ncbi:NAD-dependent epimerase/dehydratase family protein [Myceligenerans pegani]|uniref:NAD-dependent epimerase/dehydratase family protein n=1 Tax=Myceligenerans pegani TaxID=2776917 RepID=A0ABR9N0X3_9MICO|nr:NAD-dependent epimerase/dehydratase family protein [Myceligenerans sp. TRM 65318]MBE1876876.1 NAD-dependent epimerase/dehydratase family protein [Myceligenerans sp. TRM 65318]MBE3019147.1 NAD-dependent epimerase/dehydratase family protein [Myceligenerans sp. TRM 65318]
MSTTLVTGATGFIAGHVIDDLLAHGHRVRATVRSLRDPARTAHLRALADGMGGDLEFVEADLLDDAGWAAAVDGCENVLHVASPFPPTPPRDAEALVKPAVDGTMRVLRASEAAGARRVVVTSSVAAVSTGRARGDGRVRDEADWTDPDRAAPYARSKTLAERAVWRFAEEHPGVDVVAINPGLVLGPIQHAAAGTSMTTVRRLLGHEIPAVPAIGFAPVDVRDIATAHRRALEVPRAAGNRYVCAGPNVWFGEMAEILREEFGPLGYRVPTAHMPYWLLWVLARFDREVRLGLDFVGSPELVNSAKAAAELGLTLRPVRETLVDTGRSLIDHGLVTPR